MARRHILAQSERLQITVTVNKARNIYCTHFIQYAGWNLNRFFMDPICTASGPFFLSAILSPVNTKRASKHSEQQQKKKKKRFVLRWMNGSLGEASLFVLRLRVWHQQSTSKAAHFHQLCCVPVVSCFDMLPVALR